MEDNKTPICRPKPASHESEVWFQQLCHQEVGLQLHHSILWRSSDRSEHCICAVPNHKANTQDFLAYRTFQKGKPIINGWWMILKTVKWLVTSPTVLVPLETCSFSPCRNLARTPISSHRVSMLHIVYQVDRLHCLLMGSGLPHVAGMERSLSGPSTLWYNLDLVPLVSEPASNNWICVYM